MDLETQSMVALFLIRVLSAVKGPFMFPYPSRGPEGSNRKKHK